MKYHSPVINLQVNPSTPTKRTYEEFYHRIENLKRKRIWTITTAITEQKHKSSNITLKWKLEWKWKWVMQFINYFPTQTLVKLIETFCYFSCLESFITKWRISKNMGYKDCDGGISSAWSPLSNKDKNPTSSNSHQHASWKLF